MSKTAGGLTTKYLVDTNNLTGYAQVLEELQNGSVARAYTYGLERISQIQFISGQWSTSFYGYDGHGSVRQLSDSTGAVTDTYTYDAFGNLIEQTGSTPNNYLFAGEAFDAALGVYYNRARYYDTNRGRFWTMDAFEGDPQSPQSLHKYLYTSANPVNRIDPTGNFEISLPGALATAALVVSVAAIAYIQFHPRPAKLFLYWNNDFTWENFRHQRDEDGPLTSGERDRVKQNALEALKQAYSQFGAVVSEGRGGGADHTVEIANSLSISGCGQTRFSPSHYSFVSYRCVMNRAQFALYDYSRVNVIPAIGRGIGNIGAHEIGHQLGLSVVSRDADLPGFYDGGKDTDPSIYDGSGQRWTPESIDELPKKLKR